MAKKAGRLYLDVATEALKNWYPDMPEEERAELIERGDFEELESYIGARDSIEAGVDGLRIAIAETWGALLPAEEYAQRALFGKNLSYRANHQVGKIKSSVGFKPPEIHGYLVHRALWVIHDNWVMNNTEKFFDPERQDRLYMFMPLPYIGWQEAEKDLIFLHPMLRDLGIAFIEDAVQADSEDYSVKKLPQMVREGLYPALDERIRTALVEDPKLLDKVVQQVLEHR